MSMTQSQFGKPSLLSVIIPVYNEDLNVKRAHERVSRVFRERLPQYDLEIIFTDNHSNDDTFKILTELAGDDPRVKVLRFARNVGYQRSILTGYVTSEGDAVIQLDCDLQDPPELIPDLIEKWKSGYNVVYGVRRSRKEGPIITGARKVFYKLVDFLSEDHIPENAGDFRLVDRKVVQVLRSIRSKSPYLRGNIAAAGFEQVGFEYDRSQRDYGETKFNFVNLIRLSLDAIVSHSSIPLRLASLVGFTLTLTSFVLIVTYAGLALSSQSWPPGFATLAILSLLNIGVVSMFLGIIGEYIIRINEQVTIGPIAVVEASLNFPENRLAAAHQILIVNDRDSLLPKTDKSTSQHG